MGLLVFLHTLIWGGDNMVTVYVTLIIRGGKLFKDVPAKLQESVKAELLKMGLDENGAPITEEITA